MIPGDGNGRTRFLLAVQRTRVVAAQRFSDARCVSHNLVARAPGRSWRCYWIAFGMAVDIAVMHRYGQQKAKRMRVVTFGARSVQRQGGGM